MDKIGYRFRSWSDWQLDVFPISDGRLSEAASNKDVSSDMGEAETTLTECGPDGDAAGVSGNPMAPSKMEPTYRQ